MTHKKIKATKSENQVSIVYKDELFNISSTTWDQLKSLCLNYNQYIDLYKEGYPDHYSYELEKISKSIEELIETNSYTNSTVTNDILNWSKGDVLSEYSNSDIGKMLSNLDSNFIVTGSNAYLSGFNSPIPKQLLINLFQAKNQKNEYTYESLVNFWKQLVWNPNKHVRNGLFQWLQNGEWAITSEGNVITYRDVEVKQSGDKELNEAITQQWTKIKSWKKSPKNYNLHKSKKGFYLSISIETPGSLVGNLEELYKNLQDKTENSKTIYRGQYRGQYGQHIEIGKPVSMPRDEVDANIKRACSEGLHQKSLSFWLGFGEVTLVCLVSPYNIVAIPEGEPEKMRVCEYLPIGVTEKDDEGNIVEWKDGTYDISYEDMTVENLYKYISNNQIDILKKANLISEDVILNEKDLVFLLLKRVVKQHNRTEPE